MLRIRIHNLVKRTPIGLAAILAFVVFQVAITAPKLGSIATDRRKSLFTQTAGSERKGPLQNGKIEDLGGDSSGTKKAPTMDVAGQAIIAVKTKAATEAGLKKKQQGAGSQAKGKEVKRGRPPGSQATESSGNYWDIFVV